MLFLLLQKTRKYYEWMMMNNLPRNSCGVREWEKYIIKHAGFEEGESFLSGIGMGKAQQFGSILPARQKFPSSLLIFVA